MKTLEELEARHMKRAQKNEAPADEGYDAAEEQSYEDETPDALAQAQGEIADLRHQLSALQGRLTPAQQQSDEYRRLYQAEQQARQQERHDLQQQLRETEERIAQRNSRPDIEELLSEDERFMFDEGQINAIVKIADSIAASRAPKIDVRSETLKVLEEREQKKVLNYRDEFLGDPQRGLSDLSILAETPDFQTWLSQEENDDFDPLIRSFLSASSTKEVDRLGKAVARRVAKYKESRKATAANRKSDAQTSHTGGLQRRPKQASEGEVNDRLAMARRLARSRNPADHKKAQEILDQLT